MPVISTNTAANSALRYLNVNSDQQSNSLSKLASGSRITKASDDAAGLAIGTRIQSDVTVLSQAATNASQATAILQTADGGMARIGDILQRMKSLATQSDSGSVTDDERTYIDAEYQQLQEEIDGIAEGTRYNGVSLLDGTSQFSSTANLQQVSTSGLSDAQAGDLGTYLAVNIGDDFDIQTTDSSGTATTVTFTMVDYDGDTKLSLQDVADSINAGDTATPASANVQAKVVTDANGQMRLMLSTKNSGDTITDINDGTTGTVASNLGLIDTAGAIKNSGSSGGVDFMVGTSTSDTINVSIDNISVNALGLGSTSVDTKNNADSAISSLDAAISAVSSARAELGATMSRFEFRSQTIDTSSENLQSAQSAIMDADVASEKSKLSSADVKTQAAIAALTQANQMPQNLLSLLKS